MSDGEVAESEVSDGGVEEVDVSETEVPELEVSESESESEAPESEVSPDVRSWPDPVVDEPSETAPEGRNWNLLPPQTGHPESISFDPSANVLPQFVH